MPTDVSDAKVHLTLQFLKSKMGPGRDIMPIVSDASSTLAGAVRLTQKGVWKRQR